MIFLSSVYLIILLALGFLNKKLIRAKNKTLNSLGFFIWGLFISISSPLASDKVLDIEKLICISDKISAFDLIENFCAFLKCVNLKVWFFYGVISFICIFLAGLVFTELSRTPELIFGDEKEEINEKKVLTNKEVKSLKTSLKTIQNILNEKIK